MIVRVARAPVAAAGVPGSAPAGESAPGRPSRPSREGAYPSPWPDFFFLFGIDDRRAGALWGGAVVIVRCLFFGAHTTRQLRLEN